MHQIYKSMLKFSDGFLALNSVHLYLIFVLLEVFDLFALTDFKLYILMIKGI